MSLGFKLTSTFICFRIVTIILGVNLPNPLNPIVMRVLVYPIIFLFPAILCASDLLNEQFDAGIASWTVDPGKAFNGKENNGTLILRSVKEPDGHRVPGEAVYVLDGLTPGANYMLTVDFRFEKDFSDAWPWAMICIESPEPSSPGKTSVIVQERIVTRKKAGNGPTDSAWRTLEIPFNPGDNSRVVIRLSNNPSMLDQTHWDNIKVAPLDL